MSGVTATNLPSASALPCCTSISFGVGTQTYLTTFDEEVSDARENIVYNQLQNR